MSSFNTLKLFLNHRKSMKHVCICNKFISSNNKSNTDLDFHMYTSKEQLQIIDTLQKCVLNNVTRVHLSEKRLEGLRSLFKQNPHMTSLEPLLTINGVGPTLLRKLCDSILEQQEEKIDSNGENANAKPRLPSNLLTPALAPESKVESVVGIHLGINAVSWSRLRTTDGELDCWDVLDLSHTSDQKYDVHFIWDLVMRLRQLIPDGDVYVMENTNWSNVGNIKKPVKYHIQEAMLTTAICSIFNQTDSGQKSRTDLNNRLHFLRAYIPSRLFRKVVGTERVSAQDIVQNMVDGMPEKWHRPVAFTESVVERYRDRTVNGFLRDNMCQALLLVISFTELILLRNQAALSLMGRSSPNKKPS